MVGSEMRAGMEEFCEQPAQSFRCMSVRLIKCRHAQTEDQITESAQDLRMKQEWQGIMDFMCFCSPEDEHLVSTMALDLRTSPLTQRRVSTTRPLRETSISRSVLTCLRRVILDERMIR